MSSEKPMGFYVHYEYYLCGLITEHHDYIDNLLKR